MTEKKTEPSVKSSTPGKVDWNYIQGQEGGNWLVGYVPNVKNKDGKINSGVTVVGGVDLGQHTEAEIASWPWSAGSDKLKVSILEKFKPYYKQTGANAVNSLLVDKKVEHPGSPNAVHTKNHGVGQWIAPNEKYLKRSQDGTVSLKPDAPAAARKGLILTEEEGQALTYAARAQFLHETRQAYDGKTKIKGSFDKLTADQQTTLVSMHWHCGSFWKEQKAHPNRPVKQVFDAAARGDWHDAVDTLKGIGFMGSPHQKRRYDEGNRAARGSGIDPKRVGPKEKDMNDAVNRTLDKAISQLLTINRNQAGR